MITPALLAFIYGILVTPFLVWALFKYTGIKKQKVYIEAVEDKITDAHSKIADLILDNAGILNELNTIKLKAGFGAKEKNFLN